MGTGWQWKTATPVERGDWVRAHSPNCQTIDQLAHVFSLTQAGAFKILNGDIWRPEYDAPSDNPTMDEIVRDQAASLARLASR
jgi:hypothetical protein